jgi:Tfp pilus assembly protein FimT
MKKSKFTMVELLTVMIIMIILLGIGAGALVGISNKKGPDGGVRMMNRMIELTRQYAITSNTRVALMMPMDVALYSDYTGQYPDIGDDSDIGLFPDNTTPDTPGIIVRPAVVDSTGKFLRWVPDTTWTVFPPSAYYASMTGLSNVSYGDPTTGDDRAINGTTGTPTTVKALIFKPNGSLVGTTSDAVIYVKPYSAGGGGDQFDLGSAHKYMTTVNWLTGKMTTVREDNADYVGTY